MNERRVWNFEQRGDRWLVTAPDGSTAMYGGYTDDGGRFRPARAAIARMYAQAAALVAAGPPVEPAATWSALLVPEGSETSDGRVIEKGALYWRDPPLPLMLQTETDTGHFGAELAGSVMNIARDAASLVNGTGIFDKSDAGAQAIQVLTDREKFGLSVDLGQMEADEVCLQETDDGDCDEFLMTVHRGEIIGATMTPFPAFAEAFITLDTTEPEVDVEIETDEAASIAASAIPVEPPAEWFTDPHLTAATPLTITDEGEVIGHVAAWGTCHIGVAGVCTQPPRSQHDYSYFLTKATRLSGCDCDPIATGVITLGTGHADTSSATNFRAAAEHYDNTGAAVADVVTGEDDHGIWIHGALRPGLSPERVRQLRGAALSGDWRPIGGAQELVAVLAVNVPGFPIPRTKVSIAASGEPAALVAAGIVQPDDTIDTPDPLIAEVRELRSVIAEHEAFRKTVMAALGPQIAEHLHAQIRG